MSSDDAEERTTEARVQVVHPRGDGGGWQLDMVQGPGAPCALPLVFEETVIGRSPEVTIPLESVDLSRRHACFRRDGDHWTVEDLESRNGVFLNGVKVHFATLRHGDVIQLANVVLVLKEVR